MSQNNKILILIIVTAFLTVGIFSVSQGAFNPEINYQGKLTDSSNVAVADGVYHMKFRLYTAPTGGSAVWEENRSYAGGDRITLASGLFSVMLGSSTSLSSINFNQTLYLEVEIGGAASTTWEILSPRKKLGAVPAAFEADKLDGVDSASFLRSDADDSASGLLTFSGGFISQASSTISSTLRVTGESIFNNLIDASRFVATSTTATSTFAGGLAVETSGLVYDYSTNNVGIGTASPDERLTIGNINGTTREAIVIHGELNPGMDGKEAQLKLLEGPTAGFTLEYDGNPNLFNIISDNGGGSINNRLSIERDTGNIGIGTTSPYAKLSVEGSSALGNSALAGYFTATTSTASVFPYASTTAITSSGSAYFATSGGNVGIGTAAPSDKLHLTANEPIIRLQSTEPAVGKTWRLISGGGGEVGSGYFVIRNETSSVNPFSISRDATTGVNILDSGIVSIPGLVGIGTTSPYAKLSVEGSSALGNSALAGYFTATTTTATSTFMGGLAVETSGLVYDYSTGFVGIGTAAPVSNLQVLAPTGATTFTVGQSIDSVSNGISGWRAQSFTDNNIYIDTKTVASGYLYNRIGQGTETGYARTWMTVDATNGNVGIGTTTPWGKLSVDLGSGTTPAFVVGDETSPDSTPFIIDASGNVGIGTTSPYAKLSVEGSSALGNSALAGYFTATSTTATSTFAGGLSSGSFDISNATPYLTMTDTTASAKSLKIDVDGNVAQIREKDGADNSLLSFDLANNRIGIFAAPQAGGEIYFNKSISTTGFSAGVNLTYTSTGAAPADTKVGIYGGANVTGSVGEMYGLYFSAGASGSGSASLLSGSRIFTSNNGAGTVTTMSGLIIQNPLFGSGPVTNTVGIYLKKDTGTRTSRHGIYYGTAAVGSVPAGNYAIYADTDNSYFGGNVGVSSSTPWAKLSVHGLATDSDTSKPLFLVASSTASATTTHFIITNTGNVGVGTAAPAYPLDVLGTGTGAIIARFNDVNSTGCTLATGGTISCSSDISLKKNIEDIGDGLNKVLGLHPVLFNWKSEDNSSSTLKNLGFIAQEVELILPKLVSTENGGIKQLNTIGMIPLLTKAIQEQQGMIEGLKQAMASTTGLIASLSAGTSGFQFSTSNDNIISQSLGWILEQFEGIGIVISDGMIKAREFVADKITTKELCVEDVCVNRNQLKELMEKNSITPPLPAPAPASDNVNDDETSATTPTTPAENNLPNDNSVAEPAEPATEPEPEPEPEPTTIAEPEPESAPVPEPELVPESESNPELQLP